MCKFGGCCPVFALGWKTDANGFALRTHPPLSPSAYSSSTPLTVLGFLHSIKVFCTRSSALPCWIPICFLSHSADCTNCAAALPPPPEQDERDHKRAHVEEAPRPEYDPEAIAASLQWTDRGLALRRSVSHETQVELRTSTSICLCWGSPEFAILHVGHPHGRIGRDSAACEIFRCVPGWCYMQRRFPVVSHQPLCSLARSAVAR